MCSTCTVKDDCHFPVTATSCTPLCEAQKSLPDSSQMLHYTYNKISSHSSIIMMIITIIMIDDDDDEQQLWY
jgi:hypothetical protein